MAVVKSKATRVCLVRCSFQDKKISLCSEILMFIWDGYEPVVTVPVASCTAFFIGQFPDVHPHLLSFPRIFPIMQPPPPLPQSPPPLCHIALEKPTYIPSQKIARTASIPSNHFQRCPLQQPVQQPAPQQLCMCSCVVFSIISVIRV
jgi:hypothetical protein